MSAPNIKLTTKRIYKDPVHTDRRLVFGQDTEESVVREYVNPNPMVMAAGKGPRGSKCAECEFLERHFAGGSWLKCGKQKEIRGVNVDMKAGYDACALYSEGDGVSIRHW